MKSRKRTGFIMGISAAILWGTFGTFSTMLSDMGMKDGTISLIPPIFLSLLFFILVAKENLHNFKVPKKAIWVLLITGFSITLYQYAAVKAYSYLPIAIVSTIIYCNLFLTIVLSRIIFKSPISKQKLFAVCAAIIGIAMVVNLYGALNGNASISFFGILWALTAMLCWSSLVIGEKYLLNCGMDGNAIIAYEGFFSIILLSIFIQSPVKTIVNLVDSFVLSDGMIILPILGFGILTTGACYWLYIHALDRLDPAYVQIAYTMDPVTSSLLGFILFSQILLPIQIIGIITVLALVIWIQWSEREVSLPVPKESKEQTE